MNSRQIFPWMAMLCIAGLTIATSAAGEPVSTPSEMGLGTALNENALDRVRGRDGLQATPPSQYSQSTLTASISGNSLSGGTTGDNAAGNGIFAGASGIATVIQNSGNQVVIQNNVTINLNVK